MKRRGAAWTPWEDERVAALHPDYHALLRALPARTYSALRQRARHLGLVRPHHVWTNREVDRLRRASAGRLPAHDVAGLFPHLTRTQISAKARHLGLPSARRLKAFDDPVLSMIRARIIQNGVTLRVLDALAGTGRYFQRSERVFRLRPVARAAAVLGGQLSIEWDAVRPSSPGQGRAP